MSLCSLPLLEQTAGCHPNICCPVNVGFVGQSESLNGSCHRPRALSLLRGCHSFHRPEYQSSSQNKTSTNLLTSTSITCSHQNCLCIFCQTTCNLQPSRETKAQTFLQSHDHNELLQPFSLCPYGYAARRFCQSFFLLSLLSPFSSKPST